MLSSVIISRVKRKLDTEPFRQVDLSIKGSSLSDLNNDTLARAVTICPCQICYVKNMLKQFLSY
jgi:uncharacterized OsmC-like protein